VRIKRTINTLCIQRIVLYIKQAVCIVTDAVYVLNNQAIRIWLRTYALHKSRMLLSHPLILKLYKDREEREKDP
jgi:hypothetical protein